MNDVAKVFITILVLISSAQTAECGGLNASTSEKVMEEYKSPERVIALVLPVIQATHQERIESHYKEQGVPEISGKVKRLFALDAQAIQVGIGAFQDCLTKNDYPPQELGLLIATVWSDLRSIHNEPLSPKQFSDAAEGYQRVSVTSSPSECNLTVNNAVWNPTSDTGYVARGDARFVLSKEQYKKIVKSVKIRNTKGTQTVHFTLEKDSD